MKYHLRPPAPPVHATIKLDGSKSISNRLLILQHISSRYFSIQNLSTSDDSRLMQSFFEKFPKENTFNVQNAGTVTRFVTAFLAAQPGEWTLHCAPPMKNRPIKILVDALTSLGAKITYLEKDGFLPLHISGKQLQGSKITIAADVSSQYISALMMIAPTLPNGLIIELKGEVASRPYLEITERLMKQCGFRIDFQEQQIKISAGQNTEHLAQQIFNESDWSAAAFYYSACAMSPNADITLSSLHPPEKSSQGDAQAAEVFSTLGVQSDFQDHSVHLRHTGDTAQRFSFDFIDKPDMVPAVAVTCAALGVEAVFTGVKNLVIKESNRLKALQKELAKVGVNFDEINRNRWQLSGKINEDKISSVTFDTYEDHRIAMCFGTLGFLYEGVTIRNPEVVSKSYAGFWNDIQQLGVTITEE